MSEINQISHYQHLRRQYLRCSTPQIVEKLINEMQINELKSKSILKMENRIGQLESHCRTKGITLTHSKDPKLKQLKQAYELRQNQKSPRKQNIGIKQIETEKITPRNKDIQRNQYKFRELATTRTPDRQEFLYSPRSPRNTIIRQTLSDNVKIIADLTMKNQSLHSQIFSLKQQFNLLNITHENICREIEILKRTQQILLRQNNQLTLDCRYRVTQYQKSVNIIQKLLSQLQEFKGLHSQKSKVIKDIQNVNQQLQTDLNIYIRSIDQYQKKQREYLDNEGQYQEQINRLKSVGIENDIIIDKLGKQNQKLSEQFKLQVNNNSLLQQVMQEMRERNHTLQKKIFVFQEERKESFLNIDYKTKEINKHLARISELQSYVLKLKQQNSAIKQQFLKTSQQFKEQINIQLKLISDYQKIQKPKQLINMKDKFKGEERHKQFKLNNFNKRLYGQKNQGERVISKDNYQVSNEKQRNKQKESGGEEIENKEKYIEVDKEQSRNQYEEMEKSQKLKATSEGLKGLVMSIENKMSQLMGTYDALNSKTSQLTKKIPTTPKN